MGLRRDVLVVSIIFIGTALTLNQVLPWFKFSYLFDVLGYLLLGDIAPMVWSMLLLVGIGLIFDW